MGRVITMLFLKLRVLWKTFHNLLCISPDLSISATCKAVDKILCKMLTIIWIPRKITASLFFVDGYKTI